MSWYKIEIAKYFLKWYIFHIRYLGENGNIKYILWEKGSEGTAILCETTRHPLHDISKITIKVLYFRSGHRVICQSAKQLLLRVTYTSCDWNIWTYTDEMKNVVFCCHSTLGYVATTAG